MKRTITLLLIVSSTFLASCSMKSEKEKLLEKLQNESVEAVKKELKDPDSAEFRNQYGICGEVNSKNSFGGYTGYQRFMAMKDNVIIENQDPSGTFDEYWKINCAR